MKTLIISLYDGVTNCSAAILDENGRLTPIEVSRNIYYLFYYGAWKNTSTEEAALADKVKICRFLDKYESVVLCEDGEIEKIK